MTASTVSLEECRVAIQRVVGAEHVRIASSEDVIDGVAPRWVVEPGSAAELAGVLGIVHGAGLFIIPRGGGTKLEWGNAPRGVDIVLSTKRLDRTLEHAAGDMTATVQAGCSVAAFGKVLAEKGQRLALDPLWPERATIGGILASNDSGALRATFGSLRDHLIGVTIALADGTLAKSGGKVVKNVAGYDLPKLIIGSFGTLGVITEATFRLYPNPHIAQSLHFVAPTNEVLVRTLGAMANCSAVTTAVQFEMEGDSPGDVRVLVEGLPGAIQGKVHRVIQAATESGATQNNPSEDAWGDGERLFSSAESWVGKLSLLPSLWPDFLEAMLGIGARNDVRWKLIAQAMGIGLIRLQGAPVPRIADALNALRGQLDRFGGSLVLLRCPPGIKGQIDVWPDAGDALPLMQRVKEQFDPKGVLSPGRFVGGI